MLLVAVEVQATSLVDGGLALHGERRTQLDLRIASEVLGLEVRDGRWAVAQRHFRYTTTLWRRRSRWRRGRHNNTVAQAEGIALPRFRNMLATLSAVRTGHATFRGRKLVRLAHGVRQGWLRIGRGNLYDLGPENASGATI